MDCCAPTRVEPRPAGATDVAAATTAATVGGPTPRRPRAAAPAPRLTLSRRELLRGLAMTAGTVGLAACGFKTGGDGGAGLESVQLAFCGQLLCVVPYEVTRVEGYFEAEGLDVELNYSQGGSAAVQALNGGAVDFAASSFDAQLGAVANGANIRRFMTTGRLPLFALATAPETADEITAIEDLAGRQVAVSALGNADHTILRYVLDRAGVDPDGVEYATIGTNLYDALRLGQVPAGMVQEPALTLLEQDGGRTLVNFMDIDDAEEVFGGAYEFMGVAIRDGEQEERAEQLQAMARALRAGLEHVRTAEVTDIVDALPGELTAGEDLDQLADIIDRYRASLWPQEVELNDEPAQRVVDALTQAGVLEREIELDEILDHSVLA